jgi:hypothetical protein
MSWVATSEVEKVTIPMLRCVARLVAGRALCELTRSDREVAPATEKLATASVTALSIEPAIKHQVKRLVL